MTSVMSVVAPALGDVSVLSSIVQMGWEAVFHKRQWKDPHSLNCLSRVNSKLLWSKSPIMTQTLILSHKHRFPGVFLSKIAQEWVNAMIATDGRCSVTSQLLKANKHACEMELIECDRQQQCLLGRQWFSLQSWVNSGRQVTGNMMLWMCPLGDYITFLSTVKDMPWIKILNIPVLTYTCKYIVPSVRLFLPLGQAVVSWKSLMLHTQIS